MNPVARAQERFPHHATRIQTAYRYAKEQHAGQKRKTGEDYISHPVGALGYLLGFDHEAVDAETVIATLLHDVVEDTSATLSAVEERFGTDVRGLVSAMTDPEDGGTRKDRDDAHIAQLRAAAESDPRVWLVRLADQLHNAETLEVHGAERAAQIREINRTVYAPVAEALGLSAARARFQS